MQLNLLADNLSSNYREEQSMNFFERLDISPSSAPAIDWDLTPALTFTIFESWGSRYRVLSKDERYYYFFVDNWQNPAGLFLMERGIKYARVLARIEAPQELIDQCIAEQGLNRNIDRCYAVNDRLRQWLEQHILTGGESSRVFPVTGAEKTEDLTTGLPGRTIRLPDGFSPVKINAAPGALTEADVLAAIKENNFFDAQRNPAGSFSSYLVDNGDGLTVTDMATGLMWQRSGGDITSIRRAQKEVRESNRQSFAGYDDWRLPSLEEALSIMEPEKNAMGLHLHPCFSRKQPFIFVAARHLPGGYWFADFTGGTVFWASGFNPGGFGRFCRTAD